MTAQAPARGGIGRLLLVLPMTLLSYRAEAIVRILMIVSQVFLFYFLWSAVYRPGQVTGGLDLRQAITYSTLVTLLTVDRGYPIEMFSHRIRDGSIVYFFLRPVSPVLYYWAVQAGGIGFRLILTLVGAALGVLVGVVSPPSSVGLLAAVVVSVILADLIFSAFMLLLEFAAFWTTDIRGIRDLVLFAVALFTGGLVPIWFFPDWAISLLSLSPFPAAASTPISLYVGRIPATEIASSLLYQAAWLVALTGLALLVWRRAEDRVVVQGG